MARPRLIMKSEKERKMLSVLYVEDESADFARTAKLISAMGFFLYVAENGQEALRVYEDVKPDIVITDLGMPILDGIGLVSHIRTKDQSTKIIMTVDDKDAYMLPASFDLAINSYIRKPVSHVALKTAVSKCMDEMLHVEGSEVGASEYAMLSLIYSLFPDMIIVADSEAGIIQANGNAEVLTGFRERELIGRKIYSLFQDAGQSDIASVFESADNVSNWDGELQMIDKAGKKIPVSVRLCKALNSVEKSERFIFYCEDISDRKEAEEEIRKLNSELEYRVLRRTALLEATNKELDEFCDAISHDLCGPLSRLHGLSNALYEDLSESIDESGKDYLNRINQTTQQLKHIIDTLLSISQFTRRAINIQNVNLSSITESIAQNLKSSGVERKAKFYIASDVMVKGDPVLLRVVMENLFVNAWESTDSRKVAQIEFGIAKANGKAVYFVRDNGCGFDMKYANKMFKLFNMTRSTHLSGGLMKGTELASAQRIIQRHGGRIWAEGELDKGATFYFTL